MKKVIATAAISLALIGVSCSAPEPYKPYLATTTAPSPVIDVTLPEVAGRNGAIVRDELEALGLTNVMLGSSDARSTVVVLPQNWTAVSIEPAPWTVVKSDSLVVVTLTKGK